MSWLLNLYETYQASIDHVGEIKKRKNGQEYTLLPISHTTQNAHIEVTITGDGEYHSAVVVEKDNASTLIPCTDESASRAGSKIAPYPLHDKLSYVAGDFVTYGGKIKKEEPFTFYIAQLKEWANSLYANDKVKTIYQYLSKGKLIQDLVRDKVLYLDENDQLIKKWDKKYEDLHGEKPKIFTVIAGEQESAFVRFNIHSPNQILTKVWEDKEMFDSFIRFYQDMLGEKDLCFVTGESRPSTERHANKIRNAADKAKLISANDVSGFTFRGRFSRGSEAASISYEVSQKAHNALKWLINKQGKVVDQRVFLVWGNDASIVPDLTADSFSIHPNIQRNKKESNTLEEYANEIAKAIDGYKNDLKQLSKVNILVLDSATTGRMAVLYYRDIDKELYLDRLKEWHSTCAWLHRYRKNDLNEFVQFYGAPATKDIAFAAYGPRGNDKVIKGLMERMLPCIVDGQKVPKDIIRSAYQRASNPISMENWEWEKTLSIACALINKSLIEKKEGYPMALDIENEDRDYLFGRLLAVADVLERNALDSSDKRATNARRYMNSFSQHPERTWKTIQTALQPYQARLGERVWFYNRLIDEVGAKIKMEDFNNRPLSGKYLLGFYSQREALYQKRDKNGTATEEVKNGEEN
ncbi:type I-C CRISPR-associated protein Cas8c/Csd1 [Bacillus sp. SD088]|uniref:type I-C CRISPR-associated protein Cas8c/Csd1 n=1 Tax=Bacillus sp. SD088 TaxID=2782012 RepID=UPI001A95E324|nr:type I-C CRISPR-associated protein Cas8c/Csd1 [Bacillus sp. SD088]MBO0992570.1 type I-C CRISPR-associated protein Cas8c/Csd1 [Bacillus sp. SD088]